MNLKYKDSEYNKLLDDFMDELKNEKYYDAHVSLEKIWFPNRFEDCDETRLIKGFINAAVCFELIKKKRPEASEKVWKNYLKYIKLINKIDSIHIEKYHSIAKLIEKIKINF